MRLWGKLAVVAAAPLMLTGCLWGPGKFTSNLALNKSGTFVLDYKGEIVLQIPNEMNKKPDPWTDDMARCYKNGKTELAGAHVDLSAIMSDDDSDEAEAADEANEPDDAELDEVRKCTAAEIAKLKAEYDAKQAKELKEAEEMAKAMGIPGMDEESNRQFAAKLSKYAGWRSVSYRGNGVYDVDYHFEGRLTQDFIFPMMPDSEFFIPFITMRRRNDGSVQVTAPAMSGDPGMMGAAKAMGSAADKKPFSRAQGRLTFVTDGEILTNNSEDGPAAAPGGRRVYWDIGPGTKKVPEMLVKF